MSEQQTTHINQPVYAAKDYKRLMKLLYGLAERLDGCAAHTNERTKKHLRECSNIVYLLIEQHEQVKQ